MVPPIIAPIGVEDDLFVDGVEKPDVEMNFRKK